MGKYVVRRLAETVAVVFIISVVVFTAIRLAPGDPAVLRMGREASLPQNKPRLEALRREMGLDKPIPVQYLIWIGGALRGDLGVSNRSAQPVLQMIGGRLPATLELLAAALVVGVGVSVPVGVLAARRRGSLLDRGAMALVAAGLAIPSFWLGLSLILLFSVALGWLPSSGYVPLAQDPLQNLRHLLLPAITLGVYLVATFTRFLRADLIDVLGQDYIRTARAKGLTEQQVMRRHALRNALIPFITVLGVEVGALMGGAVIIEQVFGWSGLGWLTLQAIFNRDYPLVQGAVLFITVALTLVNLLVDLAYAALNPRIRASLQG